jgi:dolichol kinase
MQPGLLERLPLRKLIHLGMTVLPASAWFVADWLGLALSAAFVVASVILEMTRRQWPPLDQFLRRLLPGVFRESEDDGVLGSTWFAAGACAAFLAFGPAVGGTAVLFLAWGDPAAELAGRRWGHPGQDKTAAGSLTFLAVAILAAVAGVYLAGLHVWAAMAGALVATVIERLPPPPDDNLWIPVLSGLTMVGVRALLSWA